MFAFFTANSLALREKRIFWTVGLISEAISSRPTPKPTHCTWADVKYSGWCAWLFQAESRIWWVFWWAGIGSLWHGELFQWNTFIADIFLVNVWIRSEMWQKSTGDNYVTPRIINNINTQGLDLTPPCWIYIQIL